MIQNIEKLRAELHVEVLGNFSNAIILEDRKIEIGKAGSNQDIAPGVATKVEALWIGAKAGIAIRVIERLGWEQSAPRSIVF